MAMSAAGALRLRRWPRGEAGAEQQHAAAVLSLGRRSSAAACPRMAVQARVLEAAQVAGPRRQAAGLPGGAVECDREQTAVATSA